MSVPAIEVKGLSKRYELGRFGFQTLRTDLLRLFGRGESAEQIGSTRRFWALRDVSFDVEQGEVLGIIGHNGAGKSTLCKILSRVTEPTEGEAIMRGRTASLLEVGTGFHPDLTGRENIFLNGTILGMRHGEIQRQFDEIVAFSEVEQFLDTPVRRYSSGMQVRLAFAVAAHLQAEILVADEVLAVGDIAFQKRCLGKMRSVAASGRTVLFVSHNLAAVQGLCSRAILIDHGGLACTGTPDDVIRQYVLARSDGAARVNLPESSKSASLRSIEIVGEDGEPATEIPGQNPFRIRALYTVHSPLPGLQLDLAVNNHLGQRLFTARYTGAGPDATAQPGNYEAELSIPGDLLVPGEYSFDTTFHQPYVKYHDIQQHVISVRILATSPHAHWMGKDPGSLFITLPFTSRPSASLPE